jgi:hypothetical protein
MSSPFLFPEAVKERTKVIILGRVSFRRRVKSLGDFFCSFVKTPGIIFKKYL